jgi:hypothetical protein
VIPLVVYLLTLAPDLTWAHNGADGGDLVTAAYTLGVPHPPGYPTYTLLAWLITHVPLGSVGWRVNLLSALSAAATAALIYWTVVQLALRPAQKTRTDEPDKHQAGAKLEGDRLAIVAGLGAAWSYAFAPLVWSQALIAEVYALAGLWTALIVGLATLFFRQHEGAGLALTFGIACSLGLGVHLTLIFLTPVVIWALWQTGRSARRWTLVGFLIGLLVWLYLPLRAGRSGVTWGQPTTVEGFWWLVSGALYRHYIFALPASALGERLVAWAQVWWGGLGLIGVGLAALGAFWLGERQRNWLVASGLSFAAFNLYALGYNTTDSVVYLVPAYVIGNVWLGVGLCYLSDWIQHRRTADLVPVLRRALRFGSVSPWLIPVMLAIALVTPTWTLTRNAAALDLSGDHHRPMPFCGRLQTGRPLHYGTASKSRGYVPTWP